MLELSIEFNCEQCGRAIALDTQHAGAAVRCPGCGHVVVVPGGAPAVARESLTRATRACPQCKAVVKRQDDTCPHCKAWIGNGPPPELTARRERQREHTVGRAAVRATFADYALCTLLPPVGLLVGVVFLVRGLDRRGWVMLLYSLATGALAAALVERYDLVARLGG